MSILRLAAQLSLDGTRFKAGLKEADSAAKSFGRDVSGAIKGQLAGVFGGAAMVAFAKGALESVAALQDMADQSRMTTDEVQRMRAAAEDVGLTFSDVAMAEKSFNMKRREAVESNKELRETFARYGMTLEDLQNPQLKFADFMLRASRAMGEMSDAEKGRGATDLFDMLGKAGPKVQELVKQLEKLRDMPIVDQKTIKAADDAIDKLTRTKRQGQGLAAMVMTAPFEAALFDAYRQASFLPAGLRKWMGIKGGEKSEAPGIGEGELLEPGRVEMEEKLFEDKIAAQEAKDILQARFKLEEAIFKVQLQQMTLTDQKNAKERKLNEQIEMVEELESYGFDASKERTQAVSMLGDLLNDKGGPRPGASSMTQIGGWSGRNFQNTAESKTVEAAKALLIPAQATQKAVESIDRKVKPGKEIKAQI